MALLQSWGRAAGNCCAMFLEFFWWGSNEELCKTLWHGQVQFLSVSSCAEAMPSQQCLHTCWSTLSGKIEFPAYKSLMTTEAAAYLTNKPHHTGQQCPHIVKVQTNQSVCLCFVAHIVCIRDSLTHVISRSTNTGHSRDHKCAWRVASCKQLKEHICSFPQHHLPVASNQFWWRFELRSMWHDNWDPSEVTSEDPSKVTTEIQAGLAEASRGAAKGLTLCA